MKKAEQLEKILSAIGDDWITYGQIYQKLNGEISIGGISKIFWDNIEKIKDKIEWDAEVYGPKHWQTRMRFKKKK